MSWLTHWREYMAAVWFAFRHAKAVREWRPVDPARDIPWTEDDAERLRMWWQSPTGQRLWALVRQKETENNRQAVVINDHGSAAAREYRCGVAAGFRIGAAWILTLTEYRGPEHPATAAAPQEKETHRAASATAGDDDLRARMSP